ncbi:MAG: fumarylacetoacetate hydrolase family protein [Sulfuriferula multivorans]|uniref:Fumarylacetoacetate hydrolase family protein n=1 Tax=Sulfuriferula multivorans TaxID=1559896 RepID=A0A7C9NZK2_9PROT|nr:fumarylacetoacetate hydrolase family protein [Sulfuriferula multivorans]
MSFVELNYVVAPAPTVSVAVRGSTGRFPVRRIYCVGRNYAEHTREMGHDPDRELPFFFQKNRDNLVLDNGDFPYPAMSNNVHYEVEMVVAIGKGGMNIPTEEALDHVYGYALGLDMTRRDLQGEAKKAGRPWEIGKAFEHSAPMTDIVPVAVCGHLSKGAISLKVNGEIKQQGDLEQLIWNVPGIIFHLSSIFELKAGDLIMTGTPAGVGAIKRGDLMEGFCEGIGSISTKVV